MHHKRCEILSVGTELLLGDTLNTNAHYLAQGLSRVGLDLYIQTVVGDNPERLKQAIRDAMARAEILLFTGGLGPTTDDLTKEVVAEAFGRELVLDEEALGEIKAFYTLTGRLMPKSNEKQALMPRGGILLKNAQGTAPGCIMFSDEGHIAVLLPGPPREMQPMFDNEVAPFLQQYSHGRLYSKVVRVVGLGESQMAETLSDLIEAGTNPTLAPYAKNGEALVRVTSRAESQEAADNLIDPVVAEIRQRLGQRAYGVDVPNMETVIAQRLWQMGKTICIVESGTSGLASQRMQDTETAGTVCGPCLSAPKPDALVQALGITDGLPADEVQACAVLARQAAYRFQTPVALAVLVKGQRIACAVLVDGQLRTATRALPARGQDYYSTHAVQMAFDLLRLMITEA
ncbi:MAG: CinA family nicotinamide mononucleotide deamidase-related protein [Christensenellales bacterium]|jgi:nicotinamide-nucleotide amidase